MEPVVEAKRAYEPANKGGAFVPEDFMYGATVATCSAEIRNGFLRKVYGLLCVQLLATVAVAGLFMFHEPTRFFVTHNGSMTLLAFVSTIGFLFACHRWKHSHPANLALLAGFTLSISYSVGVTCALYQQAGLGHIVLQAFIMTAVVTASLTAYTLRSKQDFEFLGAGLFSALLALIVGSLIHWLFFAFTGVGSSSLQFVFAVFGAFIFSGFM